MKKLGTKLLLIFSVAVIMIVSVFYKSNTKNNELNINNDLNLESENVDGYDVFYNESENITYEDTGIKVMSLVNLNVRNLPSTDSEKIGILNQSEEAIYIENTNNGWYKIVYNNRFAYVSTNKEYSTLIDSNKARVIDNVINLGTSLLGVPYEFGSQRVLLWDGRFNPNFTGKTFDCSAFIQYIFYEGAGIKLSGDSRSQSKNGILISNENIQPGDILIMTSTSRQYNTGIERIGHVALYIGNNKILHTFGTGGVRIQDYSDFWKGRTIMIRRAAY